ncbi:MAG TPA: DUF2177 family protein [Candidatus Paceibacterota bacterium]|mgnify:CR=1 FL=1|nr:DUF2177 family protein [Candidatus Paceibacterota bacterium]HMP19254.1 DUF2177 family protein [Candidatus Paceibacterota bacterium]HMP85531.1 DUF2177 family protein [Candidatus Paceibacterota bacterium]
MKNLKIYLVAVFIFLIIDFVWLGFVANNFYQNQIGFLLREQFLLIPAIIFYLLFVFGLLIFAILPAVEKNSWKVALFLGGLFGLITYATYDLTNFATIKNWPFIVVVIDLIWGIFISATVSTLTFLFVQKK